MTVQALNTNTFKTITPAGQSGINMAVKIQESVTPENEKLVEKAIDVQKSLEIVQNTQLQFAVHGQSGKEVITLSDKSSGKLIRQIPSEEFLHLAARLDQMIGLMFDKTA